MTNPNDAPTPDQIIEELEHLKDDFNDEAWHSESVAKTLDEAAQALRAEQQKNEKLQSQVEALQKAVAAQSPAAASATPAAPKIDSEAFTLLIDGSGSMSSPYNSYNGTNIPLRDAIEAASDLSKSRTNVKAALWGDDKVIQQITLEGADTEALYREADVDAKGTEFLPTTDYIKETSATSDKPQHFVVISDGDFYESSEQDQNKCLANILVALSKNLTTTVDFAILGNPYSEMAQFAHTLATTFPDRVSIRIVKEKESVPLALAEIADARSPAPEPQPAAVTPVSAGKKNNSPLISM